MWQTLKKTVQMQENMKKCFAKRRIGLSAFILIPEDPGSRIQIQWTGIQIVEKHGGNVVPVLCNLSRGIFRKAAKERIDVGSL